MAQVIYLNWQPMLATLIVTTTVLPIAAASGTYAADCTPSAVPANEIGTNPITYERTVSYYGHTFLQVWQESNGIDGLQPDPTYACGGAGDLLESSVCNNCGLTL